MWALGMSKLNHSQSIGFFVYLNFLQYQACMVLEEKLNNEKTNGSEYLKLDIPSEYLAAPGQSESGSRVPQLPFNCQLLPAF